MGSGGDRSNDNDEGDEAPEKVSQFHIFCWDSVFVWFSNDLTGRLFQLYHFNNSCQEKERARSKPSQRPF
jgi:hypothetical protein